MTSKLLTLNGWLPKTVFKKTKALAMKGRAGEGDTSSYIAVISDERTG
ncbi:hypothetical protein PCC21_017190 [Pectobacterium carotovorum subsp. carotovorum PCC21]|nr:hypothetical protein PCC21_017190 [Pectobacterium carotovorum subsp. carotovorum PCC21]